MIPPHQKSSAGFTLIELLVVIGIIGFLATIIIVSLSASQDRARAAQIITDFRTIEKALILMGETDRISTWWTDTAVPGNSGATANPQISILVQSGDPLRTYLPALPIPPSNGGTNYAFDQDNDVYTGCSGASGTQGVNVLLNGSNVTMFNYIDGVIDRNEPTPPVGESNQTCGRIRWNAAGNIVIYNIARTNSF